jgi:hypothetical protein
MTTNAAPAAIFEDISAATPAEIDAQLARLGAEADATRRRLHHLREIQGRIRRGETVRDQGRRIADWEIGEFSARTAGAVLAADFRLTEIVFLMHPLETEYTERGGWRRYYLVEDGHLHYDVSGSRCSRIYSTTHYWMTEFSGQDPAEVIALAGERVCTTCFPEAPVAPRPAAARFMTTIEAERAAYAEEKARKAAAKKAAQITTPEGEELRVPRSYGGTDTIKTERAAWNRAMADATTLAWYGNKDAAAEREAIELCLAALAYRRQVTVDSLRDELNKKIATKARRDGFTVLATA